MRDRIKENVPPDELIRARFNAAERRSLFRLARSRELARRQRCVEYLWSGEGIRQNLPFFLEIADLLIPHRSEKVRWGMLCVLGDFAESSPEALWPLVLKWGSAASEDIRMGVACCILEHILEFHFTRYFQRAKEEIERGNRRFTLTMSTCYKIGQAEKPRNAQALDRFLAAVT